MAAEIGSSVGNNQAALEEQRKKQQEEAAKKAQETGQSSATDAKEKTSEKTSENSKQTDTGNKENPLSIQRPGTTDTSQTKETSNKLETDPNKISPLLPDLNKSSEKLSTKDLIASITEKIEKTKARIDANLFNQSNNPNSAAKHIASRPDTLAFAAQQVRIEASRNREEQLKLDDDRHSQTAYQEVKNHAEKLIKDGKENEAREVLKQVIDKPETLRSLARDVMAQRLSPETMNLRSIANLDSGRSETVEKMQATQHSQMTKEDHQNHTLELISGLVEKLDESAETFIRNKEMLNALINPKISESKDYINPFAELTQEPKNSTQKPKNPFELNMNLPSKSELKINPEDGFSMLHRLGSRPINEFIQKEIKDREALKETLIQQREVQLRAQANLTKLAQSGKADQIHLLFDGKGNPLSTEALKDRGSYNSGLPNELESKYRELNDFLKKDSSLEEGFAAMQDSLIGLSPEEQTVRARDFLTENLQTQRETLRLLQGINPNLNSIINDKNSSAIESLITIDQRTISQLTQETLSRRTDLMLELHDQLTENLNSGNLQNAVIAIQKTQMDIKDEVYTYRNNKLSDYELKNRDLARTPKEDEEIQQRITALEEKFKALTDDQLNIVRGNMSNIDDHLKEFKSLNEPIPLGLFQEKGWRVVGGEADIRLQSIDSLQKHTERVLDNLLSQQRNIKDAHEHMTESQQIERYERRLEEIISQTSSKYQSAGAQASHDGENIRRRLDGLDNFYGNTETGLKFTKNAALIAGATLATGGAGTWLIGAGWGLTGSGLAAAGIGTTYGAGVSLLSNTAEGISRHGNRFNNPYENVLSQTWKETKMSAGTAFSTATGMNLTRGLSAFTQAYKWGRYAPNVSKVASSTIGGGASGFVSTNLSYGLDAAEKKITTGNFDFNNEQYFKDLLWNTGAATVGGFIGGTFGQLQNATSNATTRFGLIATEELTSIAADLKITHARDGKITAEGLLQTFQASITGRTQAHFAAQNTSRPRNDLAQQIRNQETVVKSSGELPDGVEAQTKVRVEPDGSRKVEINAKEDLMRRAMNGDVEAQKKMLEETVAHARENPIDPQVKQADGSYKTMSKDQYQALRARQELAMRSVTEAKFADAQGSNVSATKQDSKTVLAEMNKAIKNGDFTRALELAEAKGVGEAYRKQFEADYEYNANRDRTKDALEQTSFHGKPDVAQNENSTKKFDALDTQITAINKKGKITAQEIDQLRKQVDNVDRLTDEQRQRLSSQLDNLDTSKLSIGEKADLAYLTGKINGNAQQRLSYEVDLAISNKYREDGPEAVTAHVKELEPRIEAQIAELQKLQKSGTDDKTLAEALGKLERLSLEMSAIRGSETVGYIAKDVEISSQVEALDSFNTGRLAESLRNPDLQADARIKAEGFISDFNLKPDDIKARENAISEIDSIGLSIYQGKLEYSPEVSKQIQDIVDSINPEHMNPAKQTEINALIADIKNDWALKQIEQLEGIAYELQRNDLSFETLDKFQKLADSIDQSQIKPETQEKLNEVIKSKNEDSIKELDSMTNDFQRGLADHSPESYQQFQKLIDSLDPSHLTAEDTQKINSLIDDIRQDARNNGLKPPNDLYVIRASNDLAPGVQAKTTIKYNNNGNPISKDSVASLELIARARSGDAEAQAIIKEETQAHGNEKPLDPLYKQDGSPREKPLTKEAYTAIRAQRELAMQVKGKALQAQAEGANVSSVKEGTQKALTDMTQAIKDGNYSEAMRIAEKNGIDQTYKDQFDRDYDHNVNPKRSHLEQTSFHTDKAPNKNFESKNTRFSEADIETVIKSSKNPELTKQIIQDGSQFTNLGSLNELTRVVNSLSEQYPIITDGKGGLADLLNYASTKTDSLNQAKITTIDDLSNLDQAISQIKSNNPNIKGISLILDSQMIQRLESDKNLTNSLTNLKDQHKLDIRFINPQGWSAGLNAFTPKSQIESTVRNIEERALKVLEINPGISKSKAVEQVFNETAVNLITKLGFDTESLMTIKNPLQNTGSSNRLLAERFNETGISEQTFNQYLKENTDSREMRQALETIWQHGFEAISLKDMSEFAINQQSKINNIAEANNINKENIYYLIPKGEETKSSQYTSNIYHNTNKTNSDQIIRSIDDIPENVKDKSMIVILDDNSLSGETQLKNYISLIDQGYEGHIVIAPSVSTKTSEALFTEKNVDIQTQKAAETAIKMVEKRSSHIREGMTAEDVQFILEARDFSKLHSVPGMIHTTFKESDAYKNLDETSRANIDKLFLNQGGYNGSGTGLVFPFMAPNNNLRIFAESGLLELFTLNSSGIKGIRGK